MIKASDQAAESSENIFTAHAVSMINIGPLKRVFSASYQPGNPQLDDSNIYIFHEQASNNQRLRIYLHNNLDNSLIQQKINEYLPEISKHILSLNNLIQEISGYDPPIYKYDIIYFPQHKDHEYGIKIQSYSTSFGTNQVHKLRFGFVINNNDLTHKRLVRDVTTNVAHELVHVALAFADINIPKVKEEQYAYLVQSCVEHHLFGSMLGIDNQNLKESADVKILNEIMKLFSRLENHDEITDTLSGMIDNRMYILSLINKNDNEKSITNFHSLCQSISIPF